jgi:hypothetical protein
MSRKTHGISRPNAHLSQPGSQTHGGSGEDAHSPAAHAFLVRLWKETRDHSGERPVWRGTLSNLQGHNVGSFGSILELGDLLARATGAGELLLRRDGDDPAPS